MTFLCLRLLALTHLSPIVISSGCIESRGGVSPWDNEMYLMLKAAHLIWLCNEMHIQLINIWNSAAGVRSFVRLTGIIRLSKNPCFQAFIGNFRQHRSCLNAVTGCYETQMHHLAMTSMSCDTLATSRAWGVGSVPDGCINPSLWQEAEMRLMSVRTLLMSAGWTSFQLLWML